MPNLTDEENRLAKRALAAMGAWQTGMRSLGMSPRRVFAVDGENVYSHGEETHRDYGVERATSGTVGLPDLDDPGTRGCLFARVQEALSLTEVQALGHVLDIMVNRGCGYAEALVVALEGGR